MSWLLTKEFKFEAAHRLPHHDGKCQRLHGHSWRLVVAVDGRQVHQSGPKRGMVIDYGDIKRVVNPLIEEKLDHHYLNDTLGMENPTSELVAQWLYRTIIKELPSLAWVKIMETCTSECVYFEDPNSVPLANDMVDGMGY